MGVRKLEHVGIMVKDLEKSITFYTEIVGLTHLYTMPHSNGIIGLAFLAGAEAQESEIELIEGYNGELPAEGRTHHVAFTVDDVEAEFSSYSRSWRPAARYRNYDTAEWCPLFLLLWPGW